VLAALNPEVKEAMALEVFATEARHAAAEVARSELRRCSRTWTLTSLPLRASIATARLESLVWRRR
jgi:hypothetical protein